MKIARGNRVLHAGAEETAEIERRLIAEISKALAVSGKVQNGAIESSPAPDAVIKG